MAMGVLIVDADAQRRQQLGTVLSFMGIPWQDVAEGDLDVAIESSGPLQGVLTGSLNGRPLGELLTGFPRVPFLSRVEADFPNSNFIGVAEAPFTYESLTRHLHFCQAFVSLPPRQQTPDKGQALLRLLVGKGKGIQEVRRLISQVAETDANVLILGESGTGKEVVARAIHELSGRSQGPFVPINCVAIPAELLESELFGHEKGAFTGATAGRAGLVEAADGGTLFLDEIGELPLEAQARLLRVLQEGEIRRVGSVQSQKVDVRLIAATHRDLKSLARNGQFREDLYYRLHVISLRLPALREREDDVQDIAQVFLARQCARMGREALSFSAEALKAIGHYHWPGNVRELENAIERAVILSEGSQIPLDLLGIDVELDEDFAPAHGEHAPAASNEPAEDLSLEDYFQHFVLEHQDHMTETELARKLGISRKCLWERRQRLGIPRRKSGAASDT